MKTPSDDLPREDNMGQIDIIIANYESTPLAINCIGSICQQIETSHVAIWVIDNGSSDEPEQIKVKFPGIHLHLNKKNLGFAAAVNQGIVKGKAPYIVLINPDAVMNNGLFDQTIQYLDDNPAVGILGPRILESDGSIQASARSFPTPLTALFGRRSLLSRLFPKNRFTKANLLADAIVDKNVPTAVDWVSGACMVIRRKAVEDVGLLDSDFFMYWEDADWCRRMWNRGWKVVYYPNSSVTHSTGESSRKNHLHASLAFHQSVYRLYRKHYPQTAKFLWPVVAGALGFRFVMVTGVRFIQRFVDLF